MKATISVTVSFPADAAGTKAAATITKKLAGLVGAEGESDDAEAEPVKRGRGRPPKNPKPAPDEDLDFGEDEETADEEDADADEESDDEEDAEEDDEAPKTKGKASAGPTLDGDIIPAFQKYANKHSRAKAAIILKKYKVKAVRDLPKAKYAEILKLLKV